jgi:hypothetical protein
MNGWKVERRYHSELIFKIFLLIAGFMAGAALLIYESYIHVR